MMKKIISIFILLVTAVLGSNYITPAEWDNILASQRSATYSKIDNTTAGAIYSGNSYTLGGKSVRYKCIKVPKITCRASSPDIVAGISETMIKSGGFSVMVWAANLRIEEDATNWYICGGAYGGVTADKSVMSSDTSDPTVLKLDYTYEANFYVDAFYGFTKPSGSLQRGDSDSAMFIKHQQICR